MKAMIARPPARPTAIEKAFVALLRHQLAPHTEARASLVKNLIGDDRILEAIIQRGTTTVATTTDIGFAALAAQHPVAIFLESIAPISAAATIMLQGLQIPMGTVGSMKLPARTGSPSTEVAWTGEGGAIPVRSYGLNEDCQLAVKKFGFIVALSRETAKRAGGEDVMRTLIREDAAATFDGATFSAEAGDATIHAGLLAGATPISGYAGGDRGAIETDLEALADVVAPGGSGQISFVVSPKRFARVGIRHPDLARALTFLPSLAVDDDDIIAVDPLSIAWGLGESIEIDVGKHATVHMEDETPLPISEPGAPPTVAAPVRSLWQTDALALRMVADIAFAPRRANAAAIVTGTTW